MSLSSLLEGLGEVRGAVTADAGGRVLEVAGEVAPDVAASSAVAMNQIAAAARLGGLSRLETVLVKGPDASIAVAARPDSLLVVSLDPSQPTRQVESALQAWAAGQPVPPPLPATRAAAGNGGNGARPLITPLPAKIPDPPRPAPAAAAPEPPRPAPAAPLAAALAPRDPWAALRRALVRGHLTEAVARQRELLPASDANSRRPGCEPVSAEACERAVQVLLEGIGSVMAGDGVGGDRILRELTDPSQQNLSFRWLALHWSARAALKCGAFPTARAHVKESLEIGRQLDGEARAVSQWTAAEVLAHDRDPTRALAWLAESRGRFERNGDAWGLGRTWLSEARVLAALQREEEAADAARRAAAADPRWDEPPIFLARRALLRDDLPQAEETVKAVRTGAADRVRALIEAIRQGVVSRTDAGEFLREHDAPPSPQSIRALARISNTSPRFVQAREALGWMLLKVGRYADAAGIFRALLSQQLSAGDRASVMLGLGCIANARQGGEEPPSIQEVVAARAAPPAPAAPEGAATPPKLSSSLIARGPQAPAGGGLDAVFSGQLSVFALPDLLEFLRSARRTGLLVCSTAGGMGALRFRDGWITGAASPATPGIGQLLLRGRKITPVALRAATAAEAGDEPDEILGARLVQDGIVDATAVQAAFEQQIGLAIRELVAWKDGEFAFKRETEGPAAPEAVSVALDPQGVLLTVFKDMDEAAAGRASAAPDAKV